MILHLFTDTNKVFTVPYMKLIREHDAEKLHVFVVWGQVVPEYPIKDVYFINDSKGYFNLLKLIYKADKIILHSLFIPKYLLAVSVVPGAIAKAYWVVWGADLHFHEYAEDNFKYKIYDMYRGNFIRKLRGICTLVIGDYELAKKWYGTKSEYFQAIYKVDGLSYAQSLPIKKRENKIRIIVGNSATESNNHFHVFELLEKFKNEDIEIICPLSYGNIEYAAKVENMGKKIFGAKFIAIKEFFTSEKYIELLNSIDVGIFDNTRQQALGNIYLLLVMQKKLYLNSSSEMWTNFRNTEKLKIFDVEELKTSSVKDIALIEENDSNKNRNIVLNKNSDMNIYATWDVIFKS